MDIHKIQDYSNRLSRSQDESILTRMKSYADEMKPSKKDGVSDFQNLLENHEEIMGKVSSSSLKVPQNIREEIKEDPYRKKLYDASVEFESVFVKMMLKEMKNTIHKEKLIDGGYAEEIFEDMLYDEYAKNISQNESMGLAEEIYKQMSASLPPVKKNPYF
ncbi:cell division protein [Leptospira bourretii]|uniref:Cell division protein n=1 Tax=Leptospira bourretii TaxID=2484962 RepID=A0A4R9IL07_9LEPT|nr:MULTISPECIES: rod-binding protein [Leptospira]MCW7460294.1 rod-binding protein [Leptospira bandrabouensis]MCW7477691.1 rod-binding protein [Leptospira bandrabouensis]MCW7485373.1 rod-binding protein [Leptospira bandrabouensis]TGK84850.1 cell division protein [Leptospira bourretii]TGK90617.1 cell division protein [Leptospira bourretii]